MIQQFWSISDIEKFAKFLAGFGGAAAFVCYCALPPEYTKPSHLFPQRDMEYERAMDLTQVVEYANAWLTPFLASFPLLSVSISFHEKFLNSSLLG